MGLVRHATWSPDNCSCENRSGGGDQEEGTHLVPTMARVYPQRRKPGAMPVALQRLAVADLYTCTSLRNSPWGDNYVRALGIIGK
eukprot:scaffold107549_cov66-Phaeocystis_antarctica.AAC.4